MFHRYLISLILLVAASFAHAGEAGRIVFVTGQAQIGNRVATLNDAVQEGDELITGRDGYVYLKTVDSGFLILRPSSRARIVAYHIDSQRPENTRVKLELLSGVARAISGQGVKQARQNFRFNTPVAAIGVRGTDFTVFTDRDVSRVTVISGGIVVSGFAGTCGPEGNGPCEGANSRELFADKAAGQLLEIKKGQSAPQLLRANGLAPDHNAPPRKDEPMTKAAPEDLNLEPQKTAVLPPAKTPSTPTTPTTPTTPAPTTPTTPTTPTIPPSLPEPPIVVAPARQEVVWGRWTAVASLPADSEVLAKLKNGEYEAGKILGSFVISRVKNSGLVMPKDGQVAFSLGNSEAYIQESGKAPVAAAVQNARLNVDFGARAFSTSLSVVGQGQQVDVYAKGDVTLKGELVGSLIGSNAAVQGYLGGASAQQAGYIFQTVGTPKLSAFGATHWSKP